MKRIGVGVVGCGFVGRGAHVPAFAEIEGASLVAVADLDEKRRKKVAAKFPLESAYADYADLVKDPNIDAVVVSVPTPLHARVAHAAIEAGKHVLCEMPLAASLEEADGLIDAAARKGVHLMPSLTFRFTSTFAKVRQLIDDGAIGRPVAAVYREVIPATDLAGQWPAESWMWKIDESGGPLYTLSVWSIDLVRWLFGADVAETHAVATYTELAKTGGTLGYDAYGALKMDNGIAVSLQYSGSVTGSAASNCLEVIGDTTLVIHAEGNESVTLHGEDPTRTEWALREHGARMWGHQQQDEHFVQCLIDGKAPSISPQDGRAAMEVAEIIARGESPALVGA